MIFQLLHLHYTPLHFAAENGNFEIVKDLLDCDGIDFNCVTIFNYTLIEFMITSNEIQICSLLITFKHVKIIQFKIDCQFIILHYILLLKMVVLKLSNFYLKRMES